MTKVIKADPKKRKNAYILFFVMAVLAILFQTDYVSSLFSIDTTGMDIIQSNEAIKQGLIYSMLFCALIFLVAVYFTYCALITSKQAFIEKSYPPEGYKSCFDTEVNYGNKAIAPALLTVIGSIFFLISSTMTGYYMLYSYNSIDEHSESVLASEISRNKFYDGLIAESPTSVSAILYNFKRGKPDEAVKLMNSLIDDGSNEALFAKASESLKGDNLPKETENSIKTLSLMCHEYVEPCLLLAINYKEEKQYDLSLQYFRKAASKDFTDVYREIRYLYNRSYLNDRDKLNEYTDKMNSAKSSLCDEIYCLTKH
ncbi:tetratricopeptide repeat protein [Colwellia piezophila]|uniref:tetratricopeptide repeat protein n=1 Tax=Colwellia piezophila TaxID=211668 RepID=UPI0003788872|nr:hypothetical protein [Colwellia piezophila]